MPEIPQRELRNDASRVLRDVRDGRSYTITVDGTPVTDLIPHRHQRPRTTVPRVEVLAAFAGLPASGEGRSTDAESAADGSLYGPYDRAYRRGDFAPEGSE